jgi:hypothetical protein
MAIDPLANLWAENGGKLYAYEMSDPVEEDTFEVDGVPMSNFVHPSWFEPFKHPAGTKFDHLGKLKKPFSMTKGGYMIIMDKKTGKVSEVFGSAKAKRFAREDRRRPSQRAPQATQFTQAQAFADSDLRTQLLVSQLRESLHSDAEDTRENLRKILEAHKDSVSHAVDNMKQELHVRVDDISERLRQLEIAFAGSGRRAH